ncbi:hypothetical protein EON65_20025 [archaeon]|nr:MAG: hypothetical protein EON65_20025 [archaeon]
MMETDKQCEQCGTVWCLAGRKYRHMKCSEGLKTCTYPVLAMIYIGITPESKLFEESLDYLHKRLDGALDREEILK